MVTPPPLKVRARWKLRLFVVLIGMGVALGLGAYLNQLEAGMVSQARAQAMLDAAKPPRPVADVTRAVRAMKLVTVEIDTKVKVERSNTSWRGDVSASIEVPVRLSYGTDLSKMDVDAIKWSELLGKKGSYVVRIPRPSRVATEVFSEREAPLVQTGWLRLRSRAGEYVLSQARKDASDEARDLVLLPEDAAKVEQVTKEQVGKLLKSIIGDDSEVDVVFSKE